LNPYIVGGVALVIAIMGWQLKSSITRNGELTVKLEVQASETLECSVANESNNTVITTLEKRVTDMVNERRIDTERREQVLVEREDELIIARARATRLEREREDEMDTNPDCADLTSLSLDMFCPDTAFQLRQRSIGESGDRDTDGSGAG
jgi:hypothetical protein